MIVCDHQSMTAQQPCARLRTTETPSVETRSSSTAKLHNHRNSTSLSTAFGIPFSYVIPSSSEWPENVRLLSADVVSIWRNSVMIDNQKHSISIYFLRPYFRLSKNSKRILHFFFFKKTLKRRCVHASNV